VRTQIENDLLFEYRSLTQEMNDIAWALAESIITPDDAEERINYITERQCEIERILNSIRMGYFK